MTQNTIQTHARALRLFKPKAGETLTVAPAESEETPNTLILGFDASTVNVTRAGNDLVFSFDDGSVTAVQGFFETGDKPLPAFVMLDGTEVSSAQVLAAMNSQMDLTTAMGGPLASTPGSGLNAYADSADALIGGVGRLGSLSSEGWATGRPFGQESETSNLTVASRMDAGAQTPEFAPSDPAQSTPAPVLTPPVSPPSPTPPVPPAPPAAELNASATASSVGEDALAPGNAWAAGTHITVGQAEGISSTGNAVSYTIGGDDSASITIGGRDILLGRYAIDTATGEITLVLGDSLSEADLEAVNSMGPGLSYNLSPITIVVTDAGLTTQTIANPIVTGTNDAPVITSVLGMDGAPLAPLSENDFTSGSANGALSAAEIFKVASSDVDEGDQTTYGFWVNGTFAAEPVDAVVVVDGRNVVIGSYSINPQTGAVTFTPSQDGSIHVLAEGRNYTSDVQVAVMDKGGLTDNRQVTVTFTGTNDMPQMSVTGDTVAEPGLVDWSGGYDSTLADQGSGKYGTVTLDCLDVDSSATEVTITLMQPNGSEGASITLGITRGADGTIAFVTPIAGGQIDSDYGILSFNQITAGGKVELLYEIKNNADTLDQGETHVDKFQVVAKDPDGQPGQDTTAPSEFAVTVTGEADVPVFTETRYGTGRDGNPNFITAGTADDAASGELKLYDIDSGLNDVTFELTSDGQSPSSLTANGSNGWTAVFDHGTVTITWNGSAWEYEYTIDARYAADNPGFKVQTIEVKAVDPSLTGDEAYSAQTAVIEVACIYPSAVPGAPTAGADTIVIDNDGTIVSFNGQPITVENANQLVNLLMNDRLSNGDPAFDNGSKNPNVSITSAQSGTIPGFGSWRISDDGVFSFTPDQNGEGFKSLGMRDDSTPETRDVYLSLAIREGGSSTDSPILIQFQGTNRPPEANAVNLEINASWKNREEYSADSNFSVRFNVSDLGNDPNASDVLSVEFSGATGEALRPGDYVFKFTDTAKGRELADQGYALRPANKPGEGDTGQEFVQELHVPDGAVAHPFAYGWLIEHADGTLEFVANQMHPEILALRANESLQQEIRFTLSDGHGGTGSKTVTVTITGDYDRKAVIELDQNAKVNGKDVLKPFYDDTGEEGGLQYSYGTRDVDAQKDADGYYQGKVVIDGMTRGTVSENATGISAIGTSGRIYLSDTTNNAAITQIVKGMEDEGNNTLKLGFLNSSGKLAQSIDVYAKVDNGDGSFTMVHVGKMGFYQNATGLWYAPPTAQNWGTGFELKGQYSDFYVDKNGTRPLTMVATDNDDTTSTIFTEVPFDVTLKFENDAPTVQSMSIDGSGLEYQLAYFDVDTVNEDLTIFIVDPEGNQVQVPVGGATYEYSFGTLAIDEKGVFSIDRTGKEGQSGVIEVFVADEESKTAGFITVGDVSNSQPLDGLGVDIALVLDGTNNKHVLVPSIVGNEFKDKGEVLNAGIYDLNHGLVGSVGGIPSGSLFDHNGYHEADPIFSLKDDHGRFVVKLPAGTQMVIASNGEAVIQIANEFEVFDTLSGQWYKVSSATIGVVFTEMANRLNAWEAENSTGKTWTAEDLANDLGIDIEFQYRPDTASASDAFETGQAVLDLPHAFKNTGQYHTDSIKPTNETVSHIKVTTAFKHDGTTEESTVTSEYGSTFASDRESDNIRFWCKTLNEDGTIDKTATEDPRTLADVLGSDGYRVASNGDIFAVNPDPIALKVYAWIQFDSEGNVLNVQSYKPADTNGWKCRQIGEAWLTPNYIGKEVVIGSYLDENGVRQDIKAPALSILNGKLTTSLWQDGENGADYMDGVYDYLNALSEGNSKNIGFIPVSTDDKLGGKAQSSVQTDGNWVIAFTGTDVIIDMQNVQLSESQALDGQPDMIGMGGTRHTYGSDRQSADGWADQGEKDADGNWTSSTAQSGFTLVAQGNYGKLIWDDDAGQYRYQLDPAYEHTVRSMVDGQSMTDTVTITMVDKNGEIKTGTVKVDINGETTSFPEGYAPEDITLSEANAAANVYSLAEVFQVQDAGDIVYHITVDFGDGPQTYPRESDLGSGTPVVDIQTDHGVLRFNYADGTFVFVPSNSLRAGETLDINVKGWVTVDNSFLPDLVTSPELSIDLSITGVNDAPTVIVPLTVNVSAGTISGYAFSWFDVDNGAEEPHFYAVHHDGNAATHLDGERYTVAGDHGTLEYDAAHGAFSYTLSGDAFTGSSRVTDTFEVSVTDGGHPQGDGYAPNGDPATSGTKSVTVYAVNGSTAEGTNADDFISVSRGLEAGKANIVIGGAGNDLIDLSGTSNQNILVWNAGDQGTVGNAAVDTIRNFMGGNDGDILDLRGLMTELKGDTTVDQLLSFSASDSAVTINIGAENATVQTIVLEGTFTGIPAEGSMDELSNYIRMLTE